MRLLAARTSWETVVDLVKLERYGWAACQTAGVNFEQYLAHDLKCLRKVVGEVTVVVVNRLKSQVLQLPQSVEVLSRERQTET
jgi:hypothetical protein